MIFTNKRGVKKTYWDTTVNNPHAEWTSKHGSVSINLVMNQLSWGGMNEAGLVISTMELVGSRSPFPDKRPWIYSNYWVQYVLDNFATVEEVISSQEQIRIQEYVDHYLVCDKAGNCVAIEFLDGQEIYHTGDDLPVKALANNAYLESIRAYKSQQTEAMVRAFDDPKLRRFIRVAERVEEYQPNTKISAIDYAFNVLDEVCGQKMSGSPTHWSIVYDTKNLQILLRTREHTEIRWLNFSELDFSRNTPVKMLDIHENVSGNIVAELLDYSSEYALAHALHAGMKWGSNPRMIEKDVKYMEQFL
jgi:choloylglycine hydrolase